MNEESAGLISGSDGWSEGAGSFTGGGGGGV